MGASLDLTPFLNFGFAAVVAGFLLVRMEAAVKELGQAVRDQTAALVAADGKAEQAIRENTATMSRLAEAINAIFIRRPRDREVPG